MSLQKNDNEVRTVSRRVALKAGIIATLLAPWYRIKGALESVADIAGSQRTSSKLKEVIGVTDADIVLGMSAAFTGPSRGLGIELYRGAQAYFQHANESGGINGRKVTLKLYDDGYQPDPSVENTMRLMLEDKVFALFGYVGTPTVTRVLPMLKKFQDQNIYLFFPFTGAQPQREPPYGEFAFNLRASYRQETAGLVDNFIRIGRKRIGVFYQADAYGRSGWAGVRQALSNHGEQIVGEATYRRGTQFTASMREQVEILHATSPDAVICVGAYAACAAFLRDAVDFGLEIPIANLSFVGSENLLKLIKQVSSDDERYTKLLVNSQVVPSYEDTSIPAVKTYGELMNLHNPPVPAAFHQNDYVPFPKSFVSLEGFLDAKMMTEILHRLGEQPERSGLEKAVFTIQDFDIGIQERVSFAPDRRQGLQSVYYTVVDKDRFIPLNDWFEYFS